MLGLEPSVVSIGVGEETALQLVATGVAGAYRLSLELVPNGEHVTLGQLQTVADVLTLGHDRDAVSGVLSCELVVADSGSMPRVLAQLTVTGVSPGPVPIVLRVSQVVDADGRELPVAIRDGAVFVVGGKDEDLGG